MVSSPLGWYCMSFAKIIREITLGENGKKLHVLLAPPSLLLIPFVILLLYVPFRHELHYTVPTFKLHQQQKKWNKLDSYLFNIPNEIRLAITVHAECNHSIIVFSVANIQKCFSFYDSTRLA